MVTKRFTGADYAVFALMLAISAAIGVYFGTRGGDQLTGGKSLHVVPVSMSVLASFLSAITLLGTPAEVYLYGSQYWVVVFAVPLMIVVTVYFYLPVFYSLGKTSAYEYLELRFNRTARMIGSIIFSAYMLIYMAIVLYAPSLALSQVTGISVWTSVLSIAAVCTFYTSLGGIKAVVWTDLFQTLMMFASMGVIVIKGAYDIGGFAKVWEINEASGRIQFLDFSSPPSKRLTVWNMLLGGFFMWAPTYACNQAMVQRYLSLPSLGHARRTIWLNLPGLIFLVTVCSFAGLLVYARYAECDPLMTRMVSAADQLYPLFVMDILGDLPGLPGFFVSGIFSGALSTISSGVNSMAAVTIEDVIKIYFKPDLSDLWIGRLTKILALIYGAITVALVAVAERLGNVLQATLSLFGVIGGPVMALFTLGMFFPFANSWGSLLGLAAGLVVAGWVNVGAMVYKPPQERMPVSVEGCRDLYTNATGNAAPLYYQYQPREDIPAIFTVSYLWYGFIGFIVSMVVGVLASWVISLKVGTKEVDPALITPPVRWLLHRVGGSNGSFDLDKGKKEVTNGFIIQMNSMKNPPAKEPTKESIKESTPKDSTKKVKISLPPTTNFTTHDVSM